MKWLKNRNRFLSEAKIGDVILPRQKKEFIRKWGKSYLEYEEIEASSNIDQGVWKLSEEDKRLVLGTFFDVDMNSLYNLFNRLPDKVIDVVKMSIDITLLDERKSNKFSRVLSNFDLKSPSLDEIYLFYENIFRKISVSETKNDEILLRDETGRPVMGEDNKPIKVKKEKGEIIFSKNLVNLYAFLNDYNDCQLDDEEKVSDDFMRELQRGLISRVKNYASEDFSGGNYEIDFGLFQQDMYLSILHNPKDILNMSISKFYTSCQHLYTGGYSSRVIGNVFDPNSVPAYLKFDSPILEGGEKISDQVPISRSIIRNLHNFDSNSSIRMAFDRSYPDRMEDVIHRMIEKYSKNKRTTNPYGNTYVFSPDIPLDASVNDPYMDRMNLRNYKYLGVNTKVLNLSKTYNWSNVIISPKADIKELIIETIDIPQNLMELNLNLDFVVFRFIDIKSLSDFKFKTNNYGFDKCKLDQSILEQIKEKESKKIKLISCDISNMDFSKFDNLEELHLVYSIEGQKLSDVIGELKLGKLVISGDLLSDPENKKFISDLKRTGTKVEIEGLKL